MKIFIITISCICQTLFCFSQFDIKPINADVNGNGVIDTLEATDSSIILVLDNKKQELLFERLGFMRLSTLSFQKNIITISGGNDGTGAYSWTYKFRQNVKTNQLQLIGFDSFSKWVSGNITKSVNLLTGMYEITLEAYNHENDKMETNKYTGKSKFHTIVLTAIKAQSFDQLKELGKQYSPE